MLTHRGFSAWVVVNDEPLPEYLIAVDQTANRVSCWIPGEEGQTFQVWWQDHGGKVETCSFIVLDGLAVPGRFLMGEGTAMRSGIRASHMTEKPFMFAKMPDRKEGDEPNTDAGTILLKIKRIKRVAPHRCNPVRDVHDVAASGKKKVGDLCIGFGQERPTTLQSPTTWSVEPYDDPASGKPSTYVSFVFRYRSADFLESQGIASGVKKQVAPKVGEKRRTSSTSVDAVPGATTTGEAKKPRLFGQGEASIASASRPSSRAPSNNYTLDNPQIPRWPANLRQPSAMQRTASGRDPTKEAQSQGTFTFYSPSPSDYLSPLLLTPNYQNPPSSQSSRTASSSGASVLALSPLSNAFSDFDEDEYHEFLC